MAAADEEPSTGRSALFSSPAPSPLLSVTLADGALFVAAEEEESASSAARPRVLGRLTGGAPAAAPASSPASCAPPNAGLAIAPALLLTGALAIAAEDDSSSAAAAAPTEEAERAGRSFLPTPAALGNGTRGGAGASATAAGACEATTGAATAVVAVVAVSLPAAAMFSATRRARSDEDAEAEAVADADAEAETAAAGELARKSAARKEVVMHEGDSGSADAAALAALTGLDAEACGAAATAVPGPAAA